MFAVVALIKVYASHPKNSVHVRLDWFNPFTLGFAPLLLGLLLGVFLFWGWDSGVSVNEETKDCRQRPGPGRRGLDPGADRDLPARLGRRAGLRRTGLPGQELDDIFSGGLGTAVLGLAAHIADHRRAHLGGGGHADDDPARRALGAVDVPTRGHSGAVR